MRVEQAAGDELASVANQVDDVAIGHVPLDAGHGRVEHPGMPSVERPGFARLENDLPGGKTGGNLARHGGDWCGGVGHESIVERKTWCEDRSSSTSGAARASGVMQPARCVSRYSGLFLNRLATRRAASPRALGVRRMPKSLLSAVALLAAMSIMNASADERPVSEVVLGVHGGTGMKKQDMTAEFDQALRADLKRALEAGYAALQRSDGTGLDAVEAAIRVLEDSEHFNAGKGAVFTREGRIEMDASIMEGKSKRAGAVGFVTTIKNPISAARAVMEKSKHVLWLGRAPRRSPQRHDLETVDPSYFRTERRWQQHQKELEREAEQKEPRDRQAGPAVARSPAVEHGRRRGAGSGRKPGRGHVDRRHVEQTVRQAGRLAHRRRRHLRRQRVLRRLGHGARRVFHPLCRGVRHRRRW